MSPLAGSGLKAALGAVSYKKEIIIAIYGGGGPYFLELLLHLRQDFLGLGMSHFLVLGAKVGTVTVTLLGVWRSWHLHQGVGAWACHTLL